MPKNCAYEIPVVAVLHYRCGRAAVNGSGSSQLIVGYIQQLLHKFSGVKLKYGICTEINR